MTFKRIFRILELTFIITVLLIVSIVTFYIIRCNNYDENFQGLEFGSHIKNVKNDWGKPDGTFIYQDTLIVLTYNDGLMTDYVFKFDKRNNKLVEKWEGD